MRSDTLFKTSIVHEVLPFISIWQVLNGFDSLQNLSDIANFKNRIDYDAYMLCDAMREAGVYDSDNLDLESGYLRLSGDTKIPHAWLRIRKTDNIIDVMPPYTIGGPQLVDLSSLRNVGVKPSEIYRCDQGVMHDFELRAKTEEYIRDKERLVERLTAAYRETLK